ncbi:hypothetical protein Hanom_Chr14g01277561 [Helianthus anomalus]
MVASWRVNLGFLGWRMAQVIKKVKRTMKAKMRKKEQSLRRSFWDLFLWWVHSLTDMVVVVVMRLLLLGVKVVWTAKCGVLEKCRRVKWRVGLILWELGVL